MKIKKIESKKVKFFTWAMLTMMLLSLTMSCSLFLSNQTEQTTTSSILEHHEPEDLVNGIVSKMQAEGYEEMKTFAELYAQAAYINSTYNYLVEIIDGNIYINGYIFDNIAYVNNCCFVYDNAILPYVSDEDKYAMLLRIQNDLGYYVLIPRDENGSENRIVVCEIDGEYYFLSSFYNDEVQKIYKLIID